MSSPQSDTTLVYQYLQQDSHWYVLAVRVTVGFAAKLTHSGPRVFVHPSAGWRDTRESLFGLTLGAEEWLGGVQS